MKRTMVILISLVLLLASCSGTDEGQVRKVMLFLGDGGGIPTLNAAGIYGHGQPQALFVQSLPHVGLMDTSSASSWVCDSAAGMTAIVTGQKTHNGVVSQSASAIRGEKDGEPLKTILEYAEERGLSTGVVSNSSIADATPAACYAHSNERGKFGEIFAQILKPRFGDGVDVVIGPGRPRILEETAALGIDLEEELPRSGYVFLDSLGALDGLSPENRRVVALFDSDDFDLGVAADHAVRVLSENPRGFFLMVESNVHFQDAERTLTRVVDFDRIIRRTAEGVGEDALIIFTADHSYDLRLPHGLRDEDVLQHVHIEDSHAAEEVLVAARGPGAERVRGYLPNTRLFHVMMEAYGWAP